MPMAARKLLIRLLSSFFYVGYLPLIPGTFGSLAAVLLLLPIADNPGLHIVSCLVLLVLGFLVCGPAEKEFGRKDPSRVVIDEVAGIFLSFLFIHPLDTRTILIGFFIFRLFDTLKPYPVSALQNLKGGLGIMLDDVMAAVYTNIVLQAVLRLTSCSFS